MSCLTLRVSSRNTPLNCRVECMNVSMGIDTKNKNSKMTVTAALVCTPWESDYEVFYVQEGAFMVEEGYFMVKKV